MTGIGVVPANPVSEKMHPARSWWNQYCSPEKGDPGVRARLRRCRSTSEALAVGEAVELARRLGDVADRTPKGEYRFEADVDLARVLSHVRTDSREHPMRAAGWPHFPSEGSQGDGENRPKLSEPRFRRLMQTDSNEELVVAFKRLIDLLGGASNVADIAEAFRKWRQPWTRDRVKRSWAFIYYNAGSAAPTDPPTEEESDE